jgi:hypothetical protein
VTVADLLVIIRCAHYQGSLRCAAGYDQNAVRDDEGRLPCLAIRGVHGTIECDERIAPAAARPRRAGLFTQALERIQRGACPTCDEPIEREREVGDAVFAWPCQHVIRRAS